MIFFPPTGKLIRRNFNTSNKLSFLGFLDILPRILTLVFWFLPSLFATESFLTKSKIKARLKTETQIYLSEQSVNPISKASTQQVNVLF